MNVFHGFCSPCSSALSCADACNITPFLSVLDTISIFGENLLFPFCSIGFDVVLNVAVVVVSDGGGVGGDGGVVVVGGGGGGGIGSGDGGGGVIAIVVVVFGGGGGGGDGGGGGGIVVVIVCGDVGLLRC